MSPISNTLQVESLAQLASILVNVTDDSEEIESADVSLTVGLLDAVTNSTEDLQKQDVSNYNLYVGMIFICPLTTFCNLCRFK